MRDVVRELLRLRYGAGRIGHTGGHLLKLVARSGSEATIGELVAGTGRRRDNVRRSLRKLEAHLLVECSGETVRLVADFAAALDLELEVSGITRSERLDREKYEREREGYAALLKERRRGRNAYWEYPRVIGADKKPDGYTSELERVEPPEESDSVVTGSDDPNQFLELAAFARREIAEHRQDRLQPTNVERAARLYCRLRQEDRECFDALCHDYRKLAWEIVGRGWTTTIYCGNTTRSALELLDREEIAA